MLRDGFNCGLFANAFAAVTGDIAYRVFLWYNYNARTFVRVLRKREAEFISEVSICCGKQRLQDFWYLSCMILQVKKAHIVWKKPIFYFDFCRFSYTFWLKGVFNFLKEDNLISLARGLSTRVYPDSLCWVLFYSASLFLHLRVTLYLTHDEVNFKDRLVFLHLKKNLKKSWFFVP